MLQKLSEKYRARLQSAAADMMRLHGAKACEAAREASKKARGKHQPVIARYWSLVAIVISRDDVSPHTVAPRPQVFVDAVIENRRSI